MPQILPAEIRSSSQKDSCKSDLVITAPMGSPSKSSNRVAECVSTKQTRCLAVDHLPKTDQRTTCKHPLPQLHTRPAQSGKGPHKRTLAARWRGSKIQDMYTGDSGKYEAVAQTRSMWRSYNKGIQHKLSESGTLCLEISQAKTPHRSRHHSQRCLLIIVSSAKLLRLGNVTLARNCDIGKRERGMEAHSNHHPHPKQSRRARTENQALARMSLCSLN